MFRETHANRVRAIVEDDRSGRRFTFENCGGVDGDLFRSETRASGDDRIDLVGNGRAADGVFDSVEHVDDVRNLLDGIGNARSRRVQQLARPAKTA